MIKLARIIIYNVSCGQDLAAASVTCAHISVMIFMSDASPKGKYTCQKQDCMEIT